MSDHYLEDADIIAGFDALFKAMSDEQRPRILAWLRAKMGVSAPPKSTFAEELERVMQGMQGLKIGAGPDNVPGQMLQGPLPLPAVSPDGVPSTTTPLPVLGGPIWQVDPVNEGVPVMIGRGYGCVISSAEVQDSQNIGGTNAILQINNTQEASVGGWRSIVDEEKAERLLADAKRQAELTELLSVTLDSANATSLEEAKPATLDTFLQHAKDFERILKSYYATPSDGDESAPKPPLPEMDMGSWGSGGIPKMVQDSAQAVKPKKFFKIDEEKLQAGLDAIKERIWHTKKCNMAEDASEQPAITIDLGNTRLAADDKGAPTTLNLTKNPPEMLLNIDIVDKTLRTTVEQFQASIPENSRAKLARLGGVFAS